MKAIPNRDNRDNIDNVEKIIDTVIAEEFLVKVSQSKTREIKTP
jgi:hypothetical protein